MHRIAALLDLGLLEPWRATDLLFCVSSAFSRVPTRAQREEKLSNDVAAAVEACLNPLLVFFHFLATSLVELLHRQFTAV